ncbi:AvrD family protein [Lentilactobacillus raoultii]|uniref:AvrD family protein n=1 Tax=Lentilactobacillus raoultii TaxID=1987503 RepID=A0ABW3PM11_9LACO|nr:AvrD family protein [Lentilactobacillus raoultii]
MEYEIDKLLGDYHQRYFGEGYKKVQHKILRFQRCANGWCGKAKISKVKSWSVKERGMPLEQHLSSIDALIISVLFSSKVFKKYHPEIELANVILASFTMKMGNSPVTNLDNIDVSFHNMVEDGNYYTIQGNVENMRIELMFYYQKAVMSNGSLRQSLDSKLSTIFFENHYRDLSNNINHITFKDKNLVSCQAAVLATSLKSYIGIESSFAQYTSLLSWLVIFAQIAEVDAYHFDGISRRESANFWARKITARLNIHKLYRVNSEIGLELEIKKANLLNMHGDNWRTLNVAASDVNHFVEFKAKMAHQLLRGK